MFECVAGTQAHRARRLVFFFACSLATTSAQTAHLVRSASSCPFVRVLFVLHLPEQCGQSRQSNLARLFSYVEMPKPSIAVSGQFQINCDRGEAVHTLRWLSKITKHANLLGQLTLVLYSVLRWVVRWQDAWTKLWTTTLLGSEEALQAGDVEDESEAVDEFVKKHLWLRAQSQERRQKNTATGGDPVGGDAMGQDIKHLSGFVM